MYQHEPRMHVRSSGGYFEGTCDPKLELNTLVSSALFGLLRPLSLEGLIIMGLCCEGAHTVTLAQRLCASDKFS